MGKVIEEVRYDDKDYIVVSGVGIMLMREFIMWRRGDLKF